MASPQTKPIRKIPAKKTSVKAKPASVDSSQKSEHEPSNTSQFEGHRVIKKYPNRRLYDTKHSTYITLFDIKGLVMTQEPFVVIDVKSGEEITRSILMQIILEEESGGHPLFSTQSLMQMIRFYGNSLQGMMSPFLEQNLNQFVDLQNQYVLHCQKIGGLSSPESWLSFINNRSSTEVMNPMQFFTNAGAQFWEQMQSQTPPIMQGFPFKPFKS
jgi:polyhydroxyalkanoate synthesis repressor PhaR